jgi:hypothetical protein
MSVRVRHPHNHQADQHSRPPMTWRCPSEDQAPRGRRARMIDVGAGQVARRAPGGPPTAEPGADAGPGAAQRRRLIKYG